MESAGSDSGDASERAHRPRECMACRGSGKVISNLADDPKKVTCPWCEGGGVRIAEIDAQAHWSGGSDAGDRPPVE